MINQVDLYVIDVKANVALSQATLINAASILMSISESFINYKEPRRVWCNFFSLKEMKSLTAHNIYSFWLKILELVVKTTI